MDWLQVLLGALAAAGLAALVRGLQRLLGVSKAVAPTTTTPEPQHSAVEAARGVLVEASDDRVDELQEELATDRPEEALAALLNRARPAPPWAMDDDE